MAIESSGVKQEVKFGEKNDVLRRENQRIAFYLRKDGASRRITRLRLALRAVAYATLSSLVLAIISQTLKQQPGCYLGEYGASRRIRTSDRSVRSRVLYPAELWMHQGTALQLFQCCSTCRNTAQYGASRRIRTSDRSVRSRVLYPAELWTKNLFPLFVAALAHILLSGTYKSNNFSQP